MGFNPNADRLRIVNDADENARLNPNNGTPVVDADLASSGRDVAAIAYDRDDADPATPTTLYGIATATGGS